VPGLDQKVVRVGIGLEPPGALIKGDLQVLERFVCFAEDSLERGEVVARFGLVGCQGDDFFQHALEFVDVTRSGVEPGNVAKLADCDVRAGEGLVKEGDGAVGLLHLQIHPGEIQKVCHIRRAGGGLRLHLLDLVLGADARVHLRLVAFQLRDETLDLIVVGVELEAGLGDDEGVINTLELEQEIDVAIYGLRAVRAEGEGLFEGKVGFADERALGLGGFLAVFGRTLLGQAPGIDAGDGTAEL